MYAMVPNIVRDASTSRNMAVLCQELFESPDIAPTLPSVRIRSARVIGLFANHSIQMNGFILEFAALSWIRPSPRAKPALIYSA